MFKFALLVFLPAVLLAQSGNFNQAVQDLFDSIDVNYDDRLSLIETESYFLSHDGDEDGNVTEHEFNQALHHASDYFYGHEKQVYDIFDQDNTGIVTKEDVDAVFHKADNNSDNHISNREFHNFLHSSTIIVG